MKIILKIIIKIYWKIFPKHLRRPCLFNESCSQFVYRQTSDYGFFKGLQALSNRSKKCRKGYILYTTNQGFEMQLVDGSIIRENDISLSILSKVYDDVQNFINNSENKSDSKQIK